jgi:hypothetical protein
MNGCMAQIVALTCYGNAHLSGHSLDPFFPANSTCQFCERVTFALLRKRFLVGGHREKEIAATPDQWFRSLKSRRAAGLRLIRTPDNRPDFPDRTSVAFVGGGGTWWIEVLLPDNNEFWAARWSAGDRDAPDQKVWRVTYLGPFAPPVSSARPVDLVQSSRELEASLREIRAFSAKHECDSFTRCFDNALETLASHGRGKHCYHHDLWPNGVLSTLGETILDACQESWVFGGMGSWNDMVFDGEEKETYERISERLFQAINSAIEGAATSTLRQ